MQTVILPVSERFSGCSVRRAYQKSDLQFPSISVRATGISDEWPGKLLMFSAEISIFIATYMVDDPEEKTLDEISSAVREILFDRSTPLLDRISAAAPELSVFAVVVGDDHIQGIAARKSDLIHAAVQLVKIIQRAQKDGDLLR